MRTQEKTDTNQATAQRRAHQTRQDDAASRASAFQPGEGFLEARPQRQRRYEHRQRDHQAQGGLFPAGEDQGAKREDVTGRESAGRREPHGCAGLLAGAAAIAKPQ